ncbi:hypothetical protein ACEN88_02575 [Massilia sp. CT11-108]|uniref:hypothetical protein n=1 Tax=Massilia sp. CT11-108 TaxID=3393900 RepID=UPI0039A6551E
MSTGAIGGYFELELPHTRTQVFPEAIRIQSARSAFLALLRAAKPSRVWMPHYLCDTMYAPLRKAGIEYMHYAIDERFHIVDEPELGTGDWLYYVNYFGVRDDYVDSLVTRYGEKRIVVDNCQAFFSKPRDCVATIFSPRKFFGVPDGGLLLTTIPVELPTHRDIDSQTRSKYLIERLASTPEAGYSSYKMAEQSLEELEPRRMSQLTDILLSTVDFTEVRRKRNKNFLALHAELARYNQCEFDPSTIDGPLCYPLLVDAAGLRDHLIAARIFVATYWPDVLGRVANTATETTLVKNLFPLPCDQRYGESEMRRIVDVCLIFLNNNKPD